MSDGTYRGTGMIDGGSGYMNAGTTAENASITGIRQQKLGEQNESISTSISQSLPYNAAQSKEETDRQRAALQKQRVSQINTQGGYEFVPNVGWVRKGQRVSNGLVG
jgi:hypothetical protein